MTYNISNNNEYNFTITTGVMTYIIPKFRCYVEVSEPFATLYWTDTEYGETGIRRDITMNFNDVLFGAYAPSSAAEVKTLIDALIIKAWTDISANFANYVPYVGANQDVDLGIYGMTTDFLAFSQTPTTGPGPAQIGYNGATLGLAYDFDTTNVRCVIGQQMYALVHNAEAVTITKGQAVYLFGASGNKASVKLAYNTSDATSAKTFGLAAEDIAANQNGLVITQGVLDGINTGAFSPGDTLYLGATAGSWTATKPYAPNHMVYVGIVEKANAGNGQIYVRTQNGYELDEIHDVDLITSPPTNGQVLTYNSSTQLWTAQTPATGSGTVTSIATTSPITGGTITTSGTIGINNAAADGSTKGAAAFTASDFNDNGSGVISIDYTNGQAASGSNKGFLTSADWTTFNSKFTLPALTSGSVLFSNGTTIAQDNANLFWDDANNRLGIGTNSPTDNFNINGTGNIGITLNSSLNGFIGLRFKFATNEYGYLFYSESAKELSLANISTGSIDFKTTSLASTRMRIFNNGNIGINTTTDAGYKLDVNGTARISTNSNAPQMYVTSTGATTRLGINHSSNTGFGLYVSDALKYSVAIFSGFGGSNQEFTIYNDMLNASALIIDGNTNNIRLRDLTQPTAYLHFPAGTASAGTAPIKLTSGTNNTTAETGAIEYNGTNLFFTRTGTTRESVLVGNAGAAAPTTGTWATPTNYYGANITNALGTPNSWASIVIGGTTYKIPLYT